VGQAHPNSVGHASACHPPGGTIAYGDVCDAKKLLIMVAVLHEDLLLTTTNSELPKEQLSLYQRAESVSTALRKIHTRTALYPHG